MKYNNVAKKKEWEYSFFQKILKIVFSRFYWNKKYCFKDENKIVWKLNMIKLDFWWNLLSYNNKLFSY